MLGAMFVLGVLLATVGALMWRRYNLLRTRASLAVAAGMTVLAFGLIGVPAYLAPLA